MSDEMRGLRLTPGQKLWRVPGDERYRRHAGWVEVLKVGRKWAELSDRSRVGMETLVVDSGGIGYADHCYRTKEEHTAKVALNKAWDQFGRVAGRYGRRPPTTIENIAEALRLLGYGDESRALIAQAEQEVAGDG